MSEQQNLPSVLYMVALPIGCDQDWSPRAKSVLESVDLVLAEDTRQFQAFAKRHALRVQAIRRLDAHTEAVVEVPSGASVALVTDAGTPGISDPGARFLGRCWAATKVSPVPGPSALSAFLSISGFSVGPVSFEGFFPREKKKREEVRARLLHESAYVWFESPRRVRDTLEVLAGWFPRAKCTVSKEMTKTFESIRHGSVETLLEGLEVEPKGEWVIGVHSREQEESSRPDEGFNLSLVQELVEKGFGLKEACHFVARARDVSRNHLYKAALRGLAEP